MTRVRVPGMPPGSWVLVDRDPDGDLYAVRGTPMGYAVCLVDGLGQVSRVLDLAGPYCAYGLTSSRAIAQAVADYLGEGYWQRGDDAPCLCGAYDHQHMECLDEGVTR